MAKEEKKKAVQEFEIIDLDISKIPRIFLQVNKKALMDHIIASNGNHRISGVHFKKKSKNKEVDHG